jgi:iron complex transport system ATP-binding protein
MGHQLEVLKLLRKLNEEEGRTIVMVVHDLNHATRYAGHMVAIKQGKVVSAGSPDEVMTQEVLREVFGIEADIIPDPRNGVPLCLPFELSDAPQADVGAETFRSPAKKTGHKAGDERNPAAVG